jgi:hypothetical protein
MLFISSKVLNDPGFRHDLPRTAETQDSAASTNVDTVETMSRPVNSPQPAGALAR